MWIGPIADTKSAIESNNQALEWASQYREQQNGLASARNVINSNDLARLTAFLPDSVDNVGLISDLNALASRSGLSLENVDVIKDLGTSVKTAGSEPLAAANPVSSVDISFSATGQYAALQGFLQDLERSQRLLDVRELTVRGSLTGVYTYKMRIRLYWLR
jgi:Tfp pilus assembly protein PilO